MKTYELIVSTYTNDHGQMTEETWHFGECDPMDCAVQEIGYFLAKYCSHWDYAYIHDANDDLVAIVDSNGEIETKVEQLVID